MKKTKLIHQAWMKKILNGRENIVIRPTPRSKSYLYRYMIIERMVLYYRQKLTLILEGRIEPPMKTPGRYGLIIGIDECTRERLIKGSWISNL